MGKWNSAESKSVCSFSSSLGGKLQPSTEFWSYFLSLLNIQISKHIWKEIQTPFGQSPYTKMSSLIAGGPSLIRRIWGWCTDKSNTCVRIQLLDIKLKESHYLMASWPLQNASTVRPENISSFLSVKDLWISFKLWNYHCTSHQRAELSHHNFPPTKFQRISLGYFLSTNSNSG